VFTVTDTKKTPNGQYLHIGCVAEGAIQLGKTKADIDVSRRGAIMRNHSSAHLLQAALKKVLGSHVEQAGSYVSDKVVRFDFTHYQAMTKEEIAEVERLVNEEILKGDVITATEMSIEDAKKTGAVALFGEKYGETVRVVKMGDFSAEFCGGTHLDNTAKVGLFKIISESSVAAGVRRIEGVTGLNSLNLIYENEKLIQETAKTIKATNINELVHKAESVINEVRAYKKALEAAQLSVATAKVKEGYANSVAVNGLNVVKVKFDDIPVEILRQALDNLLDSHPESVGVLATVTEGKVLFVAGCGKTALEKKANAGKLLSAISPIVGGGGGGRPDRASSGGKNPEKLDEAFTETDKVIKSQTEG
jgi:alanyl-tRNA synthetase